MERARFNMPAPITLPPGALNGAGYAVAAAPSPVAQVPVQTPMNVATTTWRQLVTPSAPHRQAMAQSPLGSASSMSISGGYTPGFIPMAPLWTTSPAESPTHSGQSVYTPSNVATTAWRHQVCPYAPGRREVRQTPLSSPNSSSAGLRTPANMWPSSTSSESSGTPLQENFTPSTPLRRPVLAPDPLRSRAVSWSSNLQDVTESPLPSLSSSPMNTAFVASPSVFALGGEHVRSASKETLQTKTGRIPPFFVDFIDGNRVEMGASSSSNLATLTTKGSLQTGATGEDSEWLAKLGA